MTQHFSQQLEKLKRMITSLGSEVSEAIEDAIAALQDGDRELARQVIDNDRRIDELDVQIEEACLQTLAMYRPANAELRVIVAIITINKDLERIGDAAVNMAEQAIRIAAQPAGGPVPFDLAGEARRVRSMLRHVLESLVENDPVKARMVRAADAEVDAIHREMFEQIEVAIQDNPADTGRLISLLGVSRQLERAADHAVNIAEDVVYMSTGEMIRHNKDDLFLTSGEDNPEDAAGDDVELGIG